MKISSAGLDNVIMGISFLQYRPKIFGLISLVESSEVGGKLFSPSYRVVSMQLHHRTGMTASVSLLPLKGMDRGCIYPFAMASWRSG